MPGKSRFSEEQRIAILKEGQAGANIKELCRQHGITRATYYSWRKRRRDGGMAGKRFRKESREQLLERLVNKYGDENAQLKEENGQLKQVVAELMLKLRAEQLE